MTTEQYCIGYEDGYSAGFEAGIKPAPTTQEPVAWAEPCFTLVYLSEVENPDQPTDTAIPLYTHPAPQQKPLTDEQRNAIFDAVKYEVEGCWQVDFGDVLDAVEAAHNIGVKP